MHKCSKRGMRLRLPDRPGSGRGLPGGERRRLRTSARLGGTGGGGCCSRPLMEVRLAVGGQLATNERGMPGARGCRATGASAGGACVHARGADQQHPARPTSAIARSVGRHLRQSVTPESLLVVAPAGYSLKATTPACGVQRSGGAGACVGAAWAPANRVAGRERGRACEERGPAACTPRAAPLAQGLGLPGSAAPHASRPATDHSTSLVACLVLTWHVARRTSLARCTSSGSVLSVR